MGDASSCGAHNYPDQVAGSIVPPMTGTMYRQSGYSNSTAMDVAPNPGYDAPQYIRWPVAAPTVPTDASYFANNPNNAPGPSNLPPHTQYSGSLAPCFQISLQIPNYQANNMSSVVNISQPTQADVSMKEPAFAAPGSLEENYIEYQTALGGVFQNIRGGALEMASQSLLDLSNWLLTQVTDLGLNLDDQELHGDRIKLWEDFNHAWLGLLQAQKDLSLSGRALRQGQSIMPHDALDILGKELSRLCDGIECHGLVDYHYGVWEEVIFETLIQCMDIARGSEGGSASGGAQA